MDVIPALRKSRQKDHHETMGYIVNIRPTELHGETLSQKLNKVFIWTYKYQFTDQTATILPPGNYYIFKAARLCSSGRKAKMA